MNSTTDINKIGQTLHWIVSLLNGCQIPYQIVGGLAAQAYGATRPLVDIDLYIPMEKAQVAIAEMKPYLVRKPLPHRSASWDLVYLALDYQGMLIEIGDSSTNPRFYNHRDQQWESQVIDYTASQKATLYGVVVDVMPKNELLRYKAMLDREVDHADIRAIDPSSQDIPGDGSNELSPYISLTLDLESFDDRPYTELIANLKDEGFQFTSMQELGNTQEAQRKLYILNDTTAMEMPSSNGEHAWSAFENFREEVCQMDWYKPAGQIVAIDTASGAWAAMSAITRFKGNNHAYSLHTGVDKHYRGRKLEQAVMVLAIRFAQDVLRVNRVDTDESKLNLPLIAIYRELGYI